MNKIILHTVSAISVLFFLLLASGSNIAEECGCSVPSVSIPPYVDSWEDIEENWDFIDCEIAQSNDVVEKIHIYVFYNSKINSYRCELKYSYPGNDCMMSSKLFGMNAIITADITKSTYESGKWKTYDYWLNRQMFL